jgi:hypothetical protein
MEDASVIRKTIGTYDVVYRVTTCILFCHHGRCQCFKDDYCDRRRCIHNNNIVVTMEGVSVIRKTIGTDYVVYTVTTCILLCHHGRCQCNKDDYWDERRCIHSNYIVLSPWKVPVL